jgi:GMP synthase-like glutamine amidotransferase
MKKALVIQHMMHDSAGRFATLFAQDGIKPYIVRTYAGEDIPALAPYDMMLVLGGAQDTWQEEEYPYLRMEKQAIREWVMQQAKPYFGICLGHQLLADALGGEVVLATEGEVGVFDVARVGAPGLFDGLPETMPVIQWHLAEVKRVPEMLRVTASSTRTAVQALQLEDHAFSTQFHCEFTPETVLGWAAIPSYVDALEKVHGKGAYEKLVAACWQEMPEMGRRTDIMWENFKTMTGI